MKQLSNKIITPIIIKPITDIGIEITANDGLKYLLFFKKMNGEETTAYKKWKNDFIKKKLTIK